MSRLAQPAATDIPAANAAQGALHRDWLQRLAGTEPNSAHVTPGEQAAFEALYNFYAPRLKSYLMRQGAADRADDLVQDTMIKVWQQAARYDAARASVSTWIYTIARNTWVDALRREDYPELDPLQLAPEPAATPDAALSRSETVRAVQQALAELPAAQQQVVARAIYNDESHSAIAAATGQSLGTVKGRLRLAFGKLRTMLKDKETGA